MGIKYTTIIADAIEGLSVVDAVNEIESKNMIAIAIEGVIVILITAANANIVLTMCQIMF